MRDPLDSEDDGRWFNSQPESDEADSRICKNCGNELCIHQPDPQMPELLLGICAHCKTWYLFKGDMEGIEIAQGGTNGFVQPNISIQSYGDDSHDGHL